MRKAALVAVLSMAMSFASVANVSAQVCRGTAAVTSRMPAQVGGQLAFAENVTGYGGFFTGGNDSAFVIASIGGATYDVLHASAFATGLEVGGQIPAGRKVVVCPFGAVDNLFGPNNVGGSRATLWTLGYGGGGTVGVIALETSTVQLIPGFGVIVERLRVRTKLAGATEVFNDTSKQVVLGGGVVMNKRFSIVPAVFIPFDVVDAKSTFQISFSVSFPKS